MNSERVRGVVVLACVIGCGGGGNDDTGTGPGPSPGGRTSNRVDVRDNSFDPGMTTVAPGTTVTWTWRGYNEHNVVFDDGPASGGQISRSFSRTFATAGTFGYQCTIHGASMSGDVVVK